MGRGPPCESSRRSHQAAFGSVDTANQSFNLIPADNTFSNTCPLMVNFVPSASATAGILNGATTRIVAGLYIGRAPTTSFAGINLVNSAIAHPLPNCRLYYSQVTVDPQKSIDCTTKQKQKSNLS